jgi:hypothetical protein
MMTGSKPGAQICPDSKFLTVIMLGETNAHHPHHQKLEQFFRGISVQVIASKVSHKEDMWRMMEQYHTQLNPQQLPVLFIQDSSIIEAAPEKFQAAIADALQYPWDLCYFGGYHDRCHQQITLTDSLALTSTIRGHQAVLYRPNTLKILSALSKPQKQSSYTAVLSDLLASEKLKAVVRQPHLVHFDNTVAQFDSDFLRNNVCIPIDPKPEPNQAYWWLLIIIVIVILLLVVAGLAWYHVLSHLDHSKCYDSTPEVRPVIVQ